MRQDHDPIEDLAESAGCTPRAARGFAVVVCGLYLLTVTLVGSAVVWAAGAALKWPMKG
jgi:hypothetical protein